jgi:hypothetical protein
VSEIERHNRPERAVAARHIPSEVVPVPIDEVRDFVHDAIRGTSLVDPISQLFTGWLAFEPHLRFTSVDATHTRIELDVVGLVRGAETLLFVQRRAEIDRFFVALRDELDRRDRWRPQRPSGEQSIESGE